MLFLQLDSERALGHGSEADLRPAQEPCRQLGVEQGAGHQTDLTQRRQILAGGVEHPLRFSDRLVQGRVVVEGGRVEQEHTGTAAEDLHEVGALRVAETGCPLTSTATGPCPDASAATASSYPSVVSITL